MRTYRPDATAQAGARSGLRKQIAVHDLFRAGSVSMPVRPITMTSRNVTSAVLSSWRDRLQALGTREIHGSCWAGTQTLTLWVTEGNDPPSACTNRWDSRPLANGPTCHTSQLLVKNGCRCDSPTPFVEEEVSTPHSYAGSTRGSRLRLAAPDCPYRQPQTAPGIMAGRPSGAASRRPSVRSARW